MRGRWLQQGEAGFDASTVAVWRRATGTAAIGVRGQTGFCSRSREPFRTLINAAL